MIIDLSLLGAILFLAGGILLGLADKSEPRDYQKCAGCGKNCAGCPWR